MINYTTARGVVAFVAGLGASKIVGEVIKNNTSMPDNTINKVLVGVGGFAIGGIVSTFVRAETVKNIDDMRDVVLKIRKDIDEAKTSKS